MKSGTKHIKQALTLFLAAAMLVSGTACQNNNSSSSSQQSSSSTASAVSSSQASSGAVDDKYAEKIKITWQTLSDAPVDADSPVIAALEEKYNVEIEHIYIERSDRNNLLNMRIMSGEIPDLIWLGDRRELFTEYAKQGVLAEIPVEYIKENMPNTFAGVEELCGPDIWALNQINGKNYGIPTPYSESVYPFVPIIRNDWLENLGFTKYPETIEEFEEVFYAFAKNDPNGNGNNDTYALSDKGITAIFGAFGGIPFNAKGSEGNAWSMLDGKIVRTIELPGMIDALTYLSKWYKDGVIDPEFTTGENKGQGWSSAVAFWNGTIGFSVPGMYYHSQPPLNPNNPEDKGGLNYAQFKEIQGEAATFDYIKPPVGPQGHSGVIYWGVESAAPDLVMGIQCETDTAKFERILAIAEDQNSDYDSYLLANFGIEGVHWEKGDDAEPIKRLIDTSDAQLLSNLGLSVAGATAVRNNVDFVNRTSSKYITDFKLQFKDWPKYNSAIRLRLPSSSMLETQVDASIQEGLVEFITGKRPVTQEEYDKFIANLYSMGLETLNQEAQEYYATYHTAP